jgi:hypothetical protein
MPGMKAAFNQPVEVSRVVGVGDDGRPRRRRGMLRRVLRATRTYRMRRDVMVWLAAC